MTSPIPVYLCACGCGKETPVAKHSSKRWGYKLGEHTKFVKGHNLLTLPVRPLSPGAIVPTCACGCMKPLTRYTRSRKRCGAVKGEFVKYRPGHVARKSSVVFVIESRGHVTPCWIWQMSRTAAGYGLKGSSLAHKFWWQVVNGKIQRGLELDHLCSNRACIRPDHLEPVTHGENVRRAHSRKKAKRVQ